ncbi:hypothetical protein [Pseudomonas folii]|uniref:Uncharacterized protein n=1 Tax=Pseudomonas folii TaxID=2762593 RepID=A0ABR7AWB8_9PSED|nr:hypothetical protein [Pseudomonas folii]MBC3949223.1 hypothetical protein [Pseudomonas folii]
MNDTISHKENNRRSVVLRLVTIFLIAIPVISLALNIGSWLKYGMDIPLYDDWRQYDHNDMGRLAIGYLFTPVNDTIYAVGLFLDSLNFRLFNGNTVVYQLLSLTAVLGSVLTLQWKLIKKSTDNPTIIAASFAITIFFVQPDTYWGWSNLAYHQGLPIVFSLAILMITFSENLRLKRAIPLVVAMTFLSGFSYISGAFANLTVLLTFTLMQYLISTPLKVRLRWMIIAMLPGTAITTAAQAWVIIGIQHGTHRADAPMAFPWQIDFWLFFLGKIARSLMLPAGHLKLSLVITVLVVLLTGIMAVRGLVKVYKNETTDQENKNIAIFVALITTVFVYLLLISAGRTNLRPDNMNEPLDIFAAGFQRFHFIWVTLLWPWLALSIMKAIPDQWSHKGTAIFSAMIAALLVGAIMYTPLMAHPAFYRATLNYRTTGLTCILPKFQTGEAINCETIYLSDLRKGLHNGLSAGASFSRIIPFLPIALGTDNPAPLFRLSNQLANIKLVNMSTIPGTGTELSYLSGNDPMMILPLTGNSSIENCSHLTVVAKIRSTTDSLAQVFFLTKESSGYAQENSQTVAIHNQATSQLLQFDLNSSSGFKNEIRFDPVTEPQKFTIDDLEIRCRAATAR